MAALIVVLVIVVLAVVALVRSVKMVPQANAAVVERFGRYTRTLHAGLSILVPFVDKVRNIVDLREQVVPFPPQPVITKDNLEVSIDTVIYYQITDPRAATYEIANYIQAIEQLTVTTLRNIIGGMDLERTLTSRDNINTDLRGVLDDATGRWGIRVNRVELKAIEAPLSIRDAMEKQMRAERERRAAILSAEGVKQSEILRAEGERQAQILRAEAEARSAVLKAEGEAKAIREVFEAIHEGGPDQELLAYQYLQKLPEIAKGDANKLWIVPSEFGKALEGIGGAIGRAMPNGSPGVPGIPAVPAPSQPVDSGHPREQAPIPAPVGAREVSSAPARSEARAEAQPVERRPGWSPSGPPDFRPEPGLGGVGDEPIRSTRPLDDVFGGDGWRERSVDLPEDEAESEIEEEEPLPPPDSGDRPGRRQFWTGPFRTRRPHPFLEDDGDDTED